MQKWRDAMKHMHQRKGYRLEDLVVAAYHAAREATPDPLLATIVVGKVLEDWFRRSGRMDILAQLLSVLG
jgi:hypothetical protein